MKSLFKKTLVTLCCSTMLISSFALSEASADTITEDDIDFENLTTEDETYLDELGINEDLYNLFIAIEELPEDISEEEVGNWLANRTGLEITQDGEYVNFDFLSEKIEAEESTPSKILVGNDVQKPVVSTSGWSVSGALACIGALGSLIPVTKILKINKVFKAAGGAVTVTKQVYTNYKYYRTEKKYSKTKAINQAVEDFSVKEKLSKGSKDLLKDFFSISAIAGACGPLFSYENKSEKINYLFDGNALKA